MGEKVNSKRHQSLDELKRTLAREWEKIPEDTVRSSVNAFVGRLRSCIKSKGDIFE